MALQKQHPGQLETSTPYEEAAVQHAALMRQACQLSEMQKSSQLLILFIIKPLYEPWAIQNSCQILHSWFQSHA